MSFLERVEQDINERHRFGFSSTELYEDYEELVFNMIQKHVTSLAKEFNIGEDQNESACKICWENIHAPLEAFKAELQAIFSINQPDKYETEDLEVLNERFWKLYDEYLKESLFAEELKKVDPFNNFTVGLTIQSDLIKLQQDTFRHEAAIQSHQEQLNYLGGNSQLIGLEKKMREKDSE